MLRSKEGPNQPGPIFPTLYIYFVQFFYLIKYSLQDPHYIRPRFFSQPHFATHISRPTFRDPHSQPTFATHIRDPCFTTPLVTPIRDSRS